MTTSLPIKGRLWLLVLITLAVAAFWGQDRYAFPSVDDWTYTFICPADTSDACQPVSSLHDAVLSQSRDYFRTNGRFLTHTLVQYFCGCWPMSAFVVINSLMFGLFCLCLVRLTSTPAHRPAALLTLLSAVWLIIPFKGITFMGNIALSVNYLWSSVFNLAFLMLYRQQLSRPMSSLMTMLPTLLFAFATGSLQESYSIGIVAALGIHAVVHRRTLTVPAMATAAAYTVGALTCILSPANFGRADAIGGFGFHVGSLFGLMLSPVVWLFAATVAALLLKKSLRRHLRPEHTILLAAIAVTLIFIIFVAYNGRHQLVSLNVLMFVFVGSICNAACTHRPLQRAVAVTLTAVALLTYVPILQARKTYYDAFQQLMADARTTTDGIVDGHRFERLTAQYGRNLLLDYNYVSTFNILGWDRYEHDLSLWLTRGADSRLLTTVLPDSPANIVRQCTPDREQLPATFRLGDPPLEYYIYKSATPCDSLVLHARRPSKYVVLPDEHVDLRPSDTFIYDGHSYYLFLDRQPLHVASVTAK